MKLPFLRESGHPNKDNNFIGQKIKEAREERGLTQEELAKQIYKTRVVISDMERGRTQISAVDLMDIAYVLEKPVRYFYPNYVPTSDDLEDYEWELVHFLRKIGDTTRARKVAGLLVIQAKQIAEVIIDADVELSRQDVKRREEERKAKNKK